MFSEAAIREVVDLQQRTYRLLLWMQTALEKGFISFKRAHSYTSEAAAAAEWIREHFLNLPPDARPLDRSREGLRPFSNMLISYLSTSFDLVEKPGPRLKSDCGCLCPMCRYVVAGPYLRLRQVKRGDTAKARKLKVGFLRNTAASMQIPVSDKTIDDILVDDQLSRATAMATYGAQLLLRAQGQNEGSAILALWREFAWTKERSPERGYTLDPDKVIEAEKLLTKHITAIVTTDR